MKRPHWPGFMLGTIRVVVPKVNVLIGLAAIVLAYAGLVAEWPLVTAVGLGSLCVLPIGVGMQWLHQWRFNRRAKDWPVQVQVMPGPEGERIAFVTSLDGTVSTLVIPEDYDPADDGGLWLIRQVAPSLAVLLSEDEDDAPD